MYGLLVYPFEDVLVFGCEELRRVKGRKRLSHCRGMPIF